MNAKVSNKVGWLSGMRQTTVQVSFIRENKYITSVRNNLRASDYLQVGNIHNYDQNFFQKLIQVYNRTILVTRASFENVTPEWETSFQFWNFLISPYIVDSFVEVELGVSGVTIHGNL